MPELEQLPEDWSRAIAVVAHPDDLEYGAASAIARWTGQGKDIRYVLATRGEAGIDSMAPEIAAPLRTQEQIDSAATVGVSVVEFLDHPDGLVVGASSYAETSPRPSEGTSPMSSSLPTTASDGATPARGTMSTTVSWDGRCPTLCATPPIGGCSPTKASHGLGCGGSLTARRHRRLMQST